MQRWQRKKGCAVSRKNAPVLNNCLSVSMLIDFSRFLLLWSGQAQLSKVLLSHCKSLASYVLTAQSTVFFKSAGPMGNSRRLRMVYKLASTQGTTFCSRSPLKVWNSGSVHTLLLKVQLNEVFYNLYLLLIQVSLLFNVYPPIFRLKYSLSDAGSLQKMGVFIRH